jgi:hypothetical protein
MRRWGWLILAMLAVVAPAAAAQSVAPSWNTVGMISDTVAVGFMDSSAVVSLVDYRTASLTVKLTPVAGAAEPWAIGAVSVIGSTKLAADSTSTGYLQLQPIADHSYFGSAAGDSIAWGAWATANAITAGNAEQLVRGARPNSKWPDPAAFTFQIGNKGQEGWAPYVYIRVRTLASGASGSPRWTVTMTRRK